MPGLLRMAQSASPLGQQQAWSLTPERRSAQEQPSAPVQWLPRSLESAQVLPGVVRRVFPQTSA